MARLGNCGECPLCLISLLLRGTNRTPVGLSGRSCARVAERQTRWLQVPVSERAWGFKSPLAHASEPREINDFPGFFLCFSWPLSRRPLNPATRLCHPAASAALTSLASSDAATAVTVPAAPVFTTVAASVPLTPVTVRTACFWPLGRVWFCSALTDRLHGFRCNDGVLEQFPGDDEALVHLGGGNHGERPAPAVLKSCNDRREVLVGV